MKPAFAVLACALSIVTSTGNAAPASASAKAGAYDPAQTFAPLALPGPINRYRSANGAPGSEYWQNEADYEIHANLDAAAKTIGASMAITYVNNSPDALDVLWLQLDQNIYRKDARAALVHGFRGGGSTDGYVLESVEIEQGGRLTVAPHLVSDTRMRVTLPTPLAHGGKLTLRIKYHYAIPGLFGGRTSWTTTRNGDIFDIAQWYPRMAVYDDIRGWDTAPISARSSISNTATSTISSPRPRTCWSRGPVS